MQKRRVLGISTSSILSTPHLSSFLDEYDEFKKFRAKAEFTAIAGWGLKDTAKKAHDFADQQGLPYLALEDGFLRSINLGVNGEPPTSIVVDDIGIYYDATRSSKLETILNNKETLEPLLPEASKLITLLSQLEIAKYNASPDADKDLLQIDDHPLVIVLDQTYNDMSIQRGMADENSFVQALEAALDENPNADVRIKTHPDVWAGKKKGYLTEIAKRRSVPALTMDVNWMSLAKLTSKVYAVTSHAGMEALIQNVPVSCFGMPYYAGWGLTQDQLRCERRNANLSLEELVAGVYLEYPRYIDPITGKRSNALSAVHHLARCKQWNNNNRGFTAAVSVFRWKRSHVRPFLKSTGGSLEFISNPEKAIKKAKSNGGKIVVWGGFEPPGLSDKTKAAGIPLTRMEDGFLRSSGLGSDLVPASSLVFDSRGIYYNPDSPSDLEVLLQETEFSPELINRAQALKSTILSKQITKYNYGLKSLDIPQLDLKSLNNRKILVPGQVEDDKSILFGAKEVKTNLDLLKSVRKYHPNAYIIYKPHPDVEAGNRKGKIDEQEAYNHADFILKHASSLAVLEDVDEVHTMTSLLGFEALLRDKCVSTYGLPFYAGWGLTSDHLTVPRRDRKLTVNELVAATLILYPVYFDWDSGYPCEPEQLLEKLANAVAVKPVGWWGRKIRTVRAWVNIKVVAILER